MSKKRYEPHANAHRITQDGYRFGEKCLGPAVAISSGELLQLSTLLVNTPTCLLLLHYNNQEMQRVSPVVARPLENLFKESAIWGSCSFFTRHGGRNDVCDKQPSVVKAAEEGYEEACRINNQ